MSAVSSNSRASPGRYVERQNESTPTAQENSTCRAEDLNKPPFAEYLDRCQLARLLLQLAPFSGMRSMLLHQGQMHNLRLQKMLSLLRVTTCRVTCLNARRVSDLGAPQTSRIDGSRASCATSTRRARLANLALLSSIAHVVHTHDSP
jgi:hypothetical protein